MNKVNLVNLVAEKTGISKKDTGVVIDNTIEAIMDTLKISEEVSIYGFGKFDIRERGERVGRNPKTGEEITIKASISVGFKPAKALKDAVNE